MTMLDLANGYYELPKGKLANVVTCLEMNENPQIKTVDLPSGFSLRKIDTSDLNGYRQIFRDVGENLMWFSRMIMPDDKLHDILTNPQIESYALCEDEIPVGLLELNFVDLPNCELAYFGLSAHVIGKGLGRNLMTQAINLAWVKPIDRFWVHTCHFDHPNAVGFYQRSGFKPYRMMIEIHDDPRLSGHLPLSASPQVALII